MNKVLTFLLALTFVVAPAIANVDVQESTISTEASANGDFDPDTVKIRFYVENQGTNLSEIKSKNDKTVSSAMNAIKAKLKNDETIKTTSFRVNNIYSYKDKIRIFQKYEVVNSFEVKLKDLSKTAEIIKLAMDNGVKRVDNLNFYLENTESVCNSLMKEASKIAKNRAYLIAETMGAQILKPKSINPYCSLNSNYVTKRVYSNSLMKSTVSDGAVMEEAQEAIEPGTISARAGVSVIYYLK